MFCKTMSMGQKQDTGWNRDLLKDPHGRADKHRRVEQMFARIAPKYDLLNHILSFNQDVRWRKRAVELAKLGLGERVVDFCCGTGDLALAMVESEPGLGEVVGVDFCQPMLDIARTKCSDRCKGFNIKWLCADASNTGLEEGVFDVVSCAFGIRNLGEPAAGIKEAFRVLKSGGRMVILEFAMPEKKVLGWGYGCYFRLVLPLIGSMISQDRHGAYRYLPESVRCFQANKRLEEMAVDAGFVNVKVEKLCWGAVLVLVGLKP